jgi:prepilin-type processing-associated H-X9-DG protein
LPWGPPYDRSIFLGYGASYFYLSHSTFNPGYSDPCCGGDWSRVPYKLTDFIRPSEAFLYGDAPALRYHTFFNTFTPSLWKWHTPGDPVKANVCFMDGHVSFLEIKNAGSWPGFTWFGR